MKKDTVYYLKKLIAFKTLSHDEQANDQAIAWIVSEVKNLPLYCTRYSFNGHPCLVISTRRTKKTKLMLQGHLDVVDGSEEIFIPKVSRNKLVGRGSFDMKFAIAAYLAFVQELGKFVSDYDLSIVITTDEEIGGFSGVPKLLGKGYQADICILPDGGENWYFQEGAKGVLQLEVTSKGVSAHGARPWLGMNAIDSLTEFCTALKVHFPTEPCNIQDHFHNTMTIGKIEGGESTNQVAQYAKAAIDIRFVPEFGLEKMRKLIARITKQFPSLSIRELSYGTSYTIDKNNQYLKLFLTLPMYQKKYVYLPERYEMPGNRQPLPKEEYNKAV